MTSNVEKIHAFMVSPKAGKEEDLIKEGVRVTKKDGKLFALLKRIFEDADVECDIEISFNKGEDGSQNNPCRNLFINYANKPSLPSGRKIATRLESVTTGRSGLGLLFLIYGKNKRKHKLVISRFPADTGILAEYKKNALSVQFLERVFMKNSHKYKSVIYEHASLTAGFWSGKAIDKQINSRGFKISDYWIEDFLDSSFLTTAAAGTKRLAEALREAARKSSDIEVKQEIAAAVTLAGSMAGRSISIDDFGTQLGLSPETIGAVKREIEIPSLMSDRFKFDLQEFQTQVPFRTMELSNGALLTADAKDFGKVFKTEIVDRQKRKVKVSTSGIIKDEKLGKSKLR